MNEGSKSNNLTFGGVINILFHYLIDMGFVLLPLVGYIHQYMKIKTLKSTEGFSKFISFILIMAFIIRIFFWFGDHFEYTILLNALLGLIMQLVLLQICVKYDQKLQKNTNITRFFDLKQFWNWPFFYDYFFFVALIAVLISFLSNFIGYDNKLYIFTLGVITSMIEALLDIPQIYELYISKNPHTISYLLIFGWLCGDIFKVYYYCSRNTPIQLIVCAIFQLSTDFIVVYQIWYYRQNYKINYYYFKQNFDIKRNHGRLYSIRFIDMKGYKGNEANESEMDLNRTSTNTI